MGDEKGYDVRRHLKEKVEEQGRDFEKEAQMAVLNAKYKNIPFTDGQLKMLIVLLENLEILERERLLEFSDEEKKEMSGLYETALGVLEKEEQRGKNNNYTDQLQYVTRRHGNNKY